MPISQPTFSPAEITVTGATSSRITNLSVPIAFTEVSHLLQTNVKQLIIRSRNLANLQIAFVSTESGTKYLTIPPGCNLKLDNIEFSSTTLYIQSSTASTTVEILELY
jgi:hypothetical protein